MIGNRQKCAEPLGGGVWVFWRHGGPPPKKHIHCSHCEVPRRTAAMYISQCFIENPEFGVVHNTSTERGGGGEIFGCVHNE